MISSTRRISSFNVPNNFPAFKGLRADSRVCIQSAIRLIPEDFVNQEMATQITEIFKQYTKGSKELQLVLLNSIENVLFPGQRTIKNMTTLAYLFQAMSKKESSKSLATLLGIEGFEERGKVIERIDLLFVRRSYTFSSTKNNLLNVIAKLEEHDWQDILQKIQVYEQTLNCIDDSNANLECALTIACIPINLRHDVFHHSLVFLKQIEDEIEQRQLALKIEAPHKIIKTISEISPGKREAVLARTIPFSYANARLRSVSPDSSSFSSISKDIDTLIFFISRLKEEEADTIAQTVLGLIEKHQERYRTVENICSVLELCRDKREYVFNKTDEFIERGVTTPFEFILWIIGLFSEEEASQIELFNIFAESLNDSPADNHELAVIRPKLVCEHITSVSRFHDIFKKIPCNERMTHLTVYNKQSEKSNNKNFNPEFYNLIHKHFYNQKILNFSLTISTHAGRIHFLELIDLISAKEQQEDVFQDILYLQSEEKRSTPIPAPSEGRCQLGETLKMINKRDRAKIVKIIASFVRCLEKKIKRKPSQVALSTIFHAVSCIKDYHNLKNTIEITESLYGEVFEIYQEDSTSGEYDTYFYSQGAKIIKSISKIAYHHRKRIIEKVKPLITGIIYHVDEFLGALANIPTEEIDDLIDNSLPLLFTIEMPKRSSFIKAISTYLYEEQKNLVKQVIFIIKRSRVSLDVVNLIIALCSVNEDWRKWMERELISENFNLQKRSIFNHCISVPNFLADSHRYLERQLTSTSNHVLARKFACLIKCHKNVFSASGHGDLIALMNDTLEKTTPEAVTKKKNPYKVHKELKNLSYREGLGVEALPFLTQGKRSVSLSLPKLRILAEETAAFVAADLPQSLSSDTFRELFDGVKRRVEQEEQDRLINNRPSSDEDPSLAKYIEKTYKKSLGELQANVLNGVLIPELLKIPIEPTQNISQGAFYLYAILRSIQDRDPIIRPSFPFSDREIALLNFAYAVSECTTGQMDGIVNYYNKLDSRYRFEKQVENSHANQLIDFINASIQSLMQTTFADEQMIKTMTKKMSVPQASHQSLYIKNRLYSHVGLKHDLTFDFHGELLLDELIDASLSELIKVFLIFFSPDKLISQLFEDFENASPDLQTTLQTAAQERLENLLREVRKMEQSFIGHLGRLTEEEKQRALYKYLLDSERGGVEIDPSLKSYLATLGQNELKMSLKELEKKKIISLFAEQSRGLQQIPAHVQNILNQFVRSKRDEKLKLRTDLTCIEKYDSPCSNFVKDLRQLQSVDLDLTANEFIKTIRNNTLKNQFKSYLESLKKDRLNQSLGEHLASIEKDDTPNDLIDFMRQQPQNNSLQKHLEFLSCITGVSPLKLSLKSQLEKVRSDLPLRQLLSTEDGGNYMSQVAKEFLRSDLWLPEEVSTEFKARLRQYVTDQSMQGWNLREVLRSLPKEETPITQEDIDEALAPERIIRKWQTQVSDSLGISHFHLTEEGVYALLVEAAILIPHDNLQRFRSIKRHERESSAEGIEEFGSKRQKILINKLI